MSRVVRRTRVETLKARTISTDQTSSWVKCHKTFFLQLLMNVSIKLECSSLARLSGIVLCLMVRPELTLMKHLSGVPL